MVKRRKPATIEDALVTIAGQVDGGYYAMAQRLTAQGISCGAETIRTWGDPDTRYRMPAEAIVPLDILFQEHGGEGSPFFELLDLLRGSAQAERFSEGYEIAHGAMAIVKEAGDAGAALIKASLPGATQADREAAIKEAAELDAELSRVMPVLLRSREVPESPS